MNSKFNHSSLVSFCRTIHLGRFHNHTEALPKKLENSEEISKINQEALRNKGTKSFKKIGNANWRSY